jgi:hypothetical protein
MTAQNADTERLLEMAMEMHRVQYERANRLEAENKRLMQIAIDTQDALRRALDCVAHIDGSVPENENKED